MPEPLLILSKCIIRPHHPSDPPAIAKIANSPNLVKYLTSIFPYPNTLSDAQKWLSIANPLLDYTIVALDNVTIMGGIFLKTETDIHHRTAEIGYWLGEAYWGQGIMSEVVKAFWGMMFERGMREVNGCLRSVVSFLKVEGSELWKRRALCLMSCAMLC